MKFNEVFRGDPAPWFSQRSAANPLYHIHTAAGRWLVLCFYGSAAEPGAQRALRAASQLGDVFDDVQASFFGISTDPEDEQSERVRNRYPGYRYLWDFDLSASRLYGAAPAEPSNEAKQPFRPRWVVIDSMMHVEAVFPFKTDGSDVDQVTRFLRGLPMPATLGGQMVNAPIILLPNVFEPELCKHLVGLYEKHGGEESGFMREVDGRTVAIKDASHKRRRDYHIADREVVIAAQQRFARRVFPEIKKIHQFECTRMERYIVACYDAADEAHFRAHRDNTTKGTAHRRFAVSINLNSDFDGGEVSFPEYGPRGYKPPPGGALVFSCSLLHQVSRVTRGRRYAFLPFLYDDAAAKIRAANNKYLGENVARYPSNYTEEADGEALQDAKGNEIA